MSDGYEVYLEVFLSREEAEKLEEMLQGWDEGPESMGWSSDVLGSLRGKIAEALEVDNPGWGANDGEDGP